MPVRPARAMGCDEALQVWCAPEGTTGRIGQDCRHGENSRGRFALPRYQSWLSVLSPQSGGGGGLEEGSAVPGASHSSGTGSSPGDNAVTER